MENTPQVSDKNSPPHHQGRRAESLLRAVHPARLAGGQVQRIKPARGIRDVNRVPGDHRPTLDADGAGVMLRRGRRLVGPVVGPVMGGLEGAGSSRTVENDHRTFIGGAWIGGHTPSNPPPP